MADATVKLSFGFTRKTEQKPLKDSTLRDESTREATENPDFVLSVSRNHIESSAPKVGKQELIIPLIVRNNWRLPSTVAGSNVRQNGNDGRGRGVSELEYQAVRAILEEARRSRGDVFDDDESEADSNRVIPILMQNRIPGGFETDEKMDVSLRAEVSTLDDYDRVPIEEYGMAMLKGMGWKDGQGIGLKNKKVVAPLDVNLRPKGLGLGADVRAKQGLKTKNEAADEAVSLAVGGFAQILQGHHKDAYGQVDGLDVDNARVVIRLAITSKVVTVSEHGVRPVGKNEFKKEGKLINKSKYEEYKAKSDAALETQRAELNETSSKERSGYSPSHESRRRRDSKEKQRFRKRDKEGNETSSKNSSWIRPLLRVRFIDKKYKDGKYFNTKVVIEDVVNKCVCICRTDGGRILEDIPEKWLETVIPRSDPAIIMVVKGDLIGQVGEILNKNKGKCLATIQLLPDKDVIQLDYDSICEYSGKNY